MQHCQTRFSAAAACDKIVCSAFVQSAVIGFGNMAEPDSAPSPSGNVTEKFPPAGGMGDWGFPQQAHLSYKRYACASESKPGMGVFHFIPTDNSSEIVISLDGIKADNQLLSF